MATPLGHPAHEPPVPASVRTAEAVVAAARLRYLRLQLARARRVLLAVRATRTSAQAVLAAAPAMSPADTLAWQQRLLGVYCSALDAYVRCHQAVTEEVGQIVATHNGRTNQLIDETRAAYRK